MTSAAALRLLGALALGLATTGCGNRPAEFMREPALSPVGSGIVGSSSPSGQDAASELPVALTSSSAAKPVNLYTDQRIARAGDIVTVIISINDKAQFDNSTDRSQTATTAFATDWAFTGNAASPSGKLTNDITSSSTTQGAGNIDRSEQIQLSVPAVVTQVLPNGNLMISGSQEVRVNYELRQLSVAGVVRPADISRSNTIAYDRVAEARVSYGGRGRLSEVQQPSWGQQLYDAFRPF